MSRHESVWTATAQTPFCAPLGENIHVQVCVVGGGIAGLSTAYLLARAGKSVALLDHGPLGGGMTHMSSAHLTNMMDDRYFELERLHGRIGARRTIPKSATRGSKRGRARAFPWCATSPSAGAG